ncbi:MAG: 3-dehydroquinate synthase II, partial [Methanobacterium sp.]
MKFAWIMAEGTNWDEKKGIITTALESGMDTVVDFQNISKIKKLGNIKVVSDNEDADIVLVGKNLEGDGTL